MLFDDEPGKHLDDQHISLHVREATNLRDQEYWDRLHEQNALLRERLRLAWETTLELIDQRYQIAQDHQYLRLQRQRLLREQAAYLENLSPHFAREPTPG